MYSELKAVKSALIDLSFVTTTKKQQDAILRLKKRVTDLEESLHGVPHDLLSAEFKDGM